MNMERGTAGMEGERMTRLKERQRTCSLSGSDLFP